MNKTQGLGMRFRIEDSLLPLTFYTIILLMLVPFVAQTASLEKLWQSSHSNHYVPPTTQELNHAGQLFQRTLSGEDNTKLVNAWAELGFSLESITDRGRTFTVLREQPERKQGRGFFVFARDHQSSQLFLQTPHSFKDLHTGRIGLRLFREGTFAAGAWNTVPRHYIVDDIRIDSDMAHHTASYLIPFSHTVAYHQPQARIIQLHGFSNIKRTTPAGTQAGFIVSSGSKKPSTLAHQINACLADQFSEPAYLYPRDVIELGGTQNISGKTLRRQGSNGFIHLEMSITIRQQLRKKADLRQTLLGCLTP